MNRPSAASGVDERANDVADHMPKEASACDLIANEIANRGGEKVRRVRVGSSRDTLDTMTSRVVVLTSLPAA